MFAYVLELICSRRLFGQILNEKFIDEYIHWWYDSNRDIKHCALRGKSEGTNWADINRELRNQWCRNVSMKRLYFVSFDISCLCTNTAFCSAFRLKLALKWQRCLSFASSKKLPTQTISPTNFGKKYILCAPNYLRLN